MKARVITARRAHPYGYRRCPSRRILACTGAAVTCRPSTSRFGFHIALWGAPLTHRRGTVSPMSCASRPLPAKTTGKSADLPAAFKRHRYLAV